MSAAPSAGERRPSPSLARPYAWTEGRTQPTVELPLEALVQTTSEGNSVPFNRARAGSMVIRMCAQPRSVAEIAAHLGVPLGVARVLVSDLLSGGLVTVCATLTENVSWAEHNELLERVLSGLRAL